jgi:hypothetical protein
LNLNRGKNLAKAKNALEIPIWEWAKATFLFKEWAKATFLFKKPHENFEQFQILN